jgi:site-specific recombinase XerD
MNPNREAFSWKTGEKGRNRVRVFADSRTGLLYLEVMSAGRKKRIALRHRDREAAKAAAEEVALRLRVGQEVVRHEVTLAELFDNYMREVTPTKSVGKQKHDRAVSKRAQEILGANRTVAELTHRDAARFVSERKRCGDERPGKAKKRPVGNRVICYDLQCIIAVFNWAVRGNLLNRNPFAGFRLPRNTSPRRPIVSQKEYETLLAASDAADPHCRLLLVLAHETGHRIGAIRQLRWSDVCLTGDAPSVRWRAELDKIGHEHETPLSGIAVKELQHTRRVRDAIGDGWLFPSPLDPSDPVSRHLVRDWWQKLETASNLAREPGRGWHSLRRKFATELKHAPTKDLQALGGWKDHQTILSCYQRSDAVSMKEALQTRRQLVG